jgi:hypothetical protein
LGGKAGVAHEYASTRIKASKEKSSWSDCFLSKLANLALPAAASDTSWVTENHRPFLVTSKPISVQHFSSRIHKKTTKPISVPLLSGRVADVVIRSVLHHS